MKKLIASLIVILVVLVVYFVLNTHAKKTYIFYTSVRVASNERVDYISTTNDFLSKMKDMNFEDKITSSNEYGVAIILNKIELRKITQNEEISKYYTSYEKYERKPHDRVVGLEVPYE